MRIHLYLHNMTKAQLLQELITIENELKSLRTTFRGIKQKTRGTYTKAVTKSDLRKVEEVRKKLGLG